MRAVRAWLVLVTLVAGAAIALAMVAPRGIAEDLDRQIDARLERTQYAASLLLRVNARKWIDTSAQVSRDAVLIESLDQATRGPADLALVHKTVQDRLRSFNEQMKVDLVLATDARGRVIARVGVDAAIYKDLVDGYPLVSDAMRGLRGDDTWSIGGKLYRVAASPVILRDRYVGTVVVGQEATTELAESIKSALGADVALLLRGRVIASTAMLPILDRLPIAAAAHADELSHLSHSRPLSLDGWGVVFGSFAGEASEHDALFALCVPRPASASFPELVLSLAHRDPRTLPLRALAPVAGGVVGALIVGFLLIGLVAVRPVNRLVRDAHALSRGELQRLPATSYGGELNAVAKAINNTLERIASRVRAESRSYSTPDALAREGGTTTPRLPRTPSTPVPAVANVAPIALTLDEPARADAPALESPKPLHSLAASTIAGGDFDERRTKARPVWSPGSSEPAPRGLFTQSLTPLPPPVVGSDTEPVETNEPGTDLASTAPNPVHVEARRERPTSRELPIARSASRPGFDEQTSVESPSEALLIAAAHGTSDEIEVDFQRVYEEFVATRQQCGETMDGVSFEKFVVKLRANRAQLIQRYGCSSVRFQVYIRDGRTALKATPVT